jgi:hypothetical protein
LDFKVPRKRWIRMRDGHHEDSCLLGTAEELEAPGALAQRTHEGGSVRASWGSRILDTNVLRFGACPRRKTGRSEEQERYRSDSLAGAHG